MPPITGPCLPDEPNTAACWNCWGYSNTFTYPQIAWVGMQIADQDPINGCRRGCKSCFQATLASNRSSAVRPDGTRWMKAYDPLRDTDGVIVDPDHEPERPNRLANGKMGDLLSINWSVNPSEHTDIERIRRVPKKIAFLRGTCWQNGGIEPFTDAAMREGFRHLPVDVQRPDDREGPFEWDACDCDLEPSTIADADTHLCGNTLLLHPVPGWFRDEFFYGSTNFSQPYWCRAGDDRKSKVATTFDPAGVGTVINTMMPAQIWNPTACGTNFFSQCVGVAAIGDEHCNEYDTEQRFEEWRYQQWNQLALDLSNVRLGHDATGLDRAPNLRAVDDATLDMKNRILAALPLLPNPEPGGVGQPFAQMDFLGAQNGISVATWRRAYSPMAVEPDGSLLVTLFNPGLEQCYLRKTRASVTIQPYVVSGQVDMDLQIVHLDGTQLGLATQAVAQKLYPHVRFHISAQIGYRAIPTWDEGSPPRLRKSFLPEGDDNFVPGHWDLELLNYNDADYPAEPGNATPNLPPIVRKVGEPADRHRQPDEIVYVDDQGRQFLPPTRVDWWGYMGEYSGAIPTRNVWNPRPDGQDTFPTPDCTALNAQLTGEGSLKVGGWPYLFQTVRDQDSGAIDNAQVYGGFVRLDFAGAAIPPATGACCDEETGDCTDNTTEAACLEQGLIYFGDNTLCAEHPCGPPIQVDICTEWQSLEFNAELILRDVPFPEPSAIIGNVVLILRVSAPLDVPDNRQDVTFKSWWGTFLYRTRVFGTRGSLCPGRDNADWYSVPFIPDAFEAWRAEGLARPEAPPDWNPADLQFSVLHYPDTGAGWICSEKPFGQPPFFDPEVQVCIRFSYRETGA